jgi:hypothetical protein
MSLACPPHATPTSSLFDKHLCKNVSSQQLAEYVAEVLPIDAQLLNTTDVLEQAVLRYAIAAGAQTITDADVARAAGNTSWSLSQTQFAGYAGYLLLEYHSLSWQQRTRVAHGMHAATGATVFTLEFLEKQIATWTHGGYMTGRIHEAGLRDLIFICIADFCNLLLPRLALHVHVD